MQRPRQGSKPVVYLDQNWISNITKAHEESDMFSEKDYYMSLFSAIQEGVTRNRFVCPTSSFHESEAAYGSRVKGSLWYVARLLSRKLSFNSSIEINHQQLIEAASEFAKQDLPDTCWWTIPFNRDPDTKMEAPPEISVEVHLSMDELHTDGKRLRDGIQTTLYQEFKKGRQQHNLSYEAEVEFGMKQLFVEGYAGPLVAIGLPSVAESTLQPLYRQVSLELVERCKELINICDQDGGLGKFLNSPQFSRSPFISIYARLRAADIVRFPEQTPKPSQLDDYQIIATVLPYTNVFATENYMAQLIKQTRIDKEYDCRVFTMREKQEFLEYLMNLE